MIHKIVLFSAVCFAAISLYAHNLILNVIDNNDNTITVEGLFDTGADAAGAQVRLESLTNGEVLYAKRLPIESELTIEIPNEPYQIVLDGGPGHTMIREGIEPLEGFSKELKEKVKTDNKELSKTKSSNNDWNLTTIILFTVCIILLLLAIYFSSRNTNKIIKEIKESKQA